MTPCNTEASGCSASLRNVQRFRLCSVDWREEGERTIVRKNCQISVQNADATMLATQMIAPAARNG